MQLSQTQQPQCTADDFVSKNRTVKDDSKYTTTNFAKSESNTRNNRDNRTKEANTANRQLGQTATQQRGRSHKINLGDNVESNNSNDNSFIGSNDWLNSLTMRICTGLAIILMDDNPINNHALSAPSRGVLNDKQSNPEQILSLLQLKCDFIPTWRKNI